MATTATNKQPLLIDRVLHNVIKANTLVSGSDSSLDPTGNNASAVLVDCTTNDGAIVEDIYAISRDSNAYTCLFYLSTAADYLRPNEAVFVAGMVTSTTPGATSSAHDTQILPRILAPVPQVGTATTAPLQNRALYVPKGQVLWTTLQLLSALNSEAAPIIGAQGGFY